MTPQNLIQQIKATLQLAEANNMEPQLQEVHQLILEVEKNPERHELQPYLLELNNLKKILEENESKIQIENLKKKEELCLQLERVYGDDDKRKILNLLNRSKQAWSNIGHVDRINFSAIETRFKSSCARLLEDCKDYLDEQEKLQKQTLLQREKMIVELESINQLPINYTFIRQNKRIKQIIENWKKEIPLHRQNLPLNQQFKDLLHQFYQNLSKAFEMQKEEIEQNLKDRQKLLTQLQHFSTITNADNWNKNQKQIITLYKNWIKSKKFYNQPNLDLEKEFDHVFETLFEKFNQPLHERIQKKQNLIDQLIKLTAEATKENSEIDLPRQVLELKKKWNYFTPLPLKNYHELKLHFQKNMDTLMLASPKLNDGISQLKKDNLELKKTLLEKTKILLPTKEVTATSHNEIMQVINEWEQIGDIPKRHFYEVEQEFQNLINPYFQERRSNYKIRKTNESENIQKKKNLVNRLLVLKSKFTPTPTQNLSIENLKLRLELNRQMASNQNQKKDLQQQVKSIQKEWRDIPTQGNDHALFKQFRQLCQELYNI